MQFTININQAKVVEWGLNSQQAILFSFIYECPSWCTPVKTDDGVFFAISKEKIVQELPILTTKPDTAYRLLKQLDAAGVIDLSHTPKITLVRIAERGKEWNRKVDGSEKYPSKVGKKSEVGRKNLRGRSEKSPTNQGTNQDTSNQDTNQFSDTASAKPRQSLEVAPRVDIPEDMPGPKDQTCKTFKAWANYAFAYRKRYAVWPVWNAKAGGQLGQLIDRLGADVAPQVAAYYLTVNDARLISDCHSLNNLLARAESLHTQWVTGRQMNGRTARQLEDTQANLNAAQEAASRIRDKGSKRNAFL